MPRLRFETMLTVLAAMLAQGPALAAEPAYLDNRSDAASLVRSFYNAVNRREFSRAWDYFGETKPSASFEAFVKGFEGTDHVDVVTGAISGEGAAGSQFFTVPVAIVAFPKSGGEKVYAGCYTARLTNPQLQEPPFVALHIEAAQMSPSEQPYEEKLPAACGDNPPLKPQDAALETAQGLFVAGRSHECDAIKPDGTVEAPEIHDIAFRYVGGAETDPESQARLFRFRCSTSAYNESHVYYLDKEADGVRELQFAEPELDIHYVGGNSEGKVETVAIIGYTAASTLVNSAYDAETKSLIATPKWRGVGDASSSGTWLFRDGTFTLVHYEVDASYDGEINPEVVLDYNSAP